MSYRRRGSSNYVVIRKQGIQPVRVVRHSLSKKRAQHEADEFNRQFKDRNDIKFAVRVEGWNRKKWWSHKRQAAAQGSAKAFANSSQAFYANSETIGSSLDKLIDICN